MNIYWSHYLYLLLLIPLFIRLIIKAPRNFDRKFSRYAEPGFSPLYLSRRSPFYSGLKLFLLLFVFVMMVFALARPQWDFREQDLQNRGMDIVFAIDVSQSMLATDIKPDRLTRSLLQVAAFVEQLKTDRIGIISFAGSATLECPLTDDHEALKMVLSSLSTDSAARPGTDIGRAIDLATSAFNAGSGGGVLILISDGEDISGNALGKARDLAAEGIRIYTMGVGSPEGASIRNPHTGAEHFSKLDESTLKQIADIGSGAFFRITPSASEIQLLLSQIYQSELAYNRSRKSLIYKEQYHIFVIAALLLLVLDIFTKPYRRSARGKR